MKLTYFIFGLGNCIIYYSIGETVLTMHSDIENKFIQAIEAREMNYKLGDHFNFWGFHVCIFDQEL